MNKYDQLPNESNKAYRIRLYKNKEQYGLSNPQIGELCNIAFGVNYDESAHRKKVKNYLEGYEDAKVECAITNNDNFIEEIAIQKRELEQLKIQYRDERRAWNQQNYIVARVNKTLDLLKSSVQDVSKTVFPVSVDDPYDIKTDTALVVCLSDLHIGQTFDTPFGQYNSDIAKERLGEYLTEIKTISARHNISDCYILCLGDEISGNIHKTIAVTNREDVIKQVKLASEYISSFCYELKDIFNHIYVHSASGNHSRIEVKEDANHTERLDDLVIWSVKNMLRHINNITVVDANVLDNGIISVKIFDKEYIGVHGDFDSTNKNGLGSLAMLLGHLPYAVVSGHKHFNAYSGEIIIKTVQSGSLAGSGDAYTIEKRLGGKPCQTAFVCSPKGIECLYPIEF